MLANKKTEASKSLDTKYIESKEPFIVYFTSLAIKINNQMILYTNLPFLLLVVFIGPGA